MRNQPERAGPHYQQAWRAAAQLTEKLDGKSYTEVIFGKPVLLHMVRPERWNRYAQRPPTEVEVRNVLVEFTVDALGRPDALEVLDDSGDVKRGERTACVDQEHGALPAAIRKRRARGDTGRAVQPAVDPAVAASTGSSERPPIRRRQPPAGDASPSEWLDRQLRGGGGGSSTSRGDDRLRRGQQSARDGLLVEFGRQLCARIAHREPRRHGQRLVALARELAGGCEPYPVNVQLSASSPCGE